MPICACCLVNVFKVGPSKFAFPGFIQKPAISCLCEAESCSAPDCLLEATPKGPPWLGRVLCDKVGWCSCYS